MAKQYLVRFGSDDPANHTGLSPTLSVFRELTSGTAITAPGITEVPAASGLYYFTWNPTMPIAFVCDGGAALSANIRYASGLLDPVDAVNEQVTALGVTMTFNFTGLLGTTGATFGGASTDPGTVFGYLKRLQELQEGNANFNKVSGAWEIYSRGSSTLFASKTLTNSSSLVTKT